MTCASVSLTYLKSSGSVKVKINMININFSIFRVTGNMISGAAQQHKKRLIPLRKTEVSVIKLI
jgi:hypothetical protein